MKYTKFITFTLASVVTVLSVSCGSVPERKVDRGPKSDESAIPWNRRLKGEGQNALGGFGGFGR